MIPFSPGINSVVGHNGVRVSFPCCTIAEPLKLNCPCAPLPNPSS